MRTDRPDDPTLVAEVVARLMRMRAELGARAFRSAVDRTLHAIAAAAHQEAERRANRPRDLQRVARRTTDNVVQFPLGPSGERTDA